MVPQQQVKSAITISLIFEAKLVRIICGTIIRRSKIVKNLINKLLFD